MGLPKGHTNNPNGRPQGSKNKSSEAIREMVSALITDNWEQIKLDIKLLPPLDRLAYVEKLLQYVTPKLQAQAVKVEDDSKEININPIHWVNSDGETEYDAKLLKAMEILQMQPIATIQVPDQATAAKYKELLKKFEDEV